MSTPTVHERVRYHVDRFMARGGSSLVVSLILVFLGLLAIIMVLRLILLQVIPDRGNEHVSFFETFLEMSDPGRLAEFNTTSRWFRLTAVLATAFGLIFLSSLIAILTTSLDRRLTKLRRGHSRVLESDHTLILGWSPQRVIEIVKQLILANEVIVDERRGLFSKRYAPVVILADLPKEEMDEFLAVHVKERLTTRIITRSGDPSDLAALDLVAVDSAKSAIVLSGVTSTAPERLRDAADAQVFKVLLALSTYRENPSDTTGSTDLNIVAEIMGELLHEPARKIWPERITPLCPADILAKILVETSRSLGLSAVYQEILSFAGAELYFHREKDWGGATFGDLAVDFERGIPIGVRSDHKVKTNARPGREPAPGTASPDIGPGTHTSGRHVTLNPDPALEMRRGDEVLILATDDSDIRFKRRRSTKPNVVSHRTWHETPDIERQLLVGWTSKSRALIKEYDQYVVDGSRIDVMVDHPDAETFAAVEAINDAGLEHTRVELIDQDPTNPATWAPIEAGKYNNIVILADDDEDHAELIDAQTIMTLFLVRDLLADRSDGGTPTNVITELVGSENEALARKAGVHDFVVSPSFVSMLLAQLSEERDLAPVYDELFDPDGAEIYLKPVSWYFRPPWPVTLSFAELLTVAEHCGEVCLGYKLKSDEQPSVDRDPPTPGRRSRRAGRNGHEKLFGVHLIPKKDQKIRLHEDDRLVVLAEDHT